MVRLCIVKKKLNGKYRFLYVFTKEEAKGDVPAVKVRRESIDISEEELRKLPTFFSRQTKVPTQLVHLSELQVEKYFTNNPS